MRKRSKQGSFADLKDTSISRTTRLFHRTESIYFEIWHGKRIKIFSSILQNLRRYTKKNISLSLPFIIYKRFLYKENILFYSNLYIKILN